MTKMGFSEKWIGSIMMCVESISYSIMVNDEPVDPIFLGRGLCQGDPLSPYLSILCAEGLTALIDQAERRGELHGKCICRGAPIVTHLFFTDDFSSSSKQKTRISWYEKYPQDL